MGIRSMRHGLGETGKGINRGGGWVRFARSAWERRIERPNVQDPRDLLILLRQASDSADAAVLRAMAPVTERYLGPVRPAHLTHLHILRRLDTREITPTHLVDYLTRSKARVAVLVDELVDAELVVRSVDHDDARHRRLLITPRGRAMVREVERTLDRMIDLVGDDIGDIRALSRQLKVLADLR